MVTSRSPRAALSCFISAMSAALMPADPRGCNETIEWVFAALNSVEMASLSWSIMKFTGDAGNAPVDEFLKIRLKHLEPVLAGREWLASITGVPTADVLRLADGFDGLAGIRPAETMSRAPRRARAL
jgi:glutathione S-transferase